MKTFVTTLGAALIWALLGDPSTNRAYESRSGQAKQPADGPSSAPHSALRTPHSVVGGKHDFSEVLGAPGGACNPCHVPHVQAVRPTTQPTTQPAVELYRIVGQRAVFEPGRYTPGPTSLICLGCHDGTVATSTIGSAHAMLAGAREGFDIPEGFGWRDHPIGMLYPNDPKNYRPESFVLAEGKIRLPDGRMECVSCHDPHGGSGVEYMLVMSNRKSALCLACHIK